MRRRRPAFAAADERPIVDLNTTPLIDVLLVLLIMFILTIPIATHSVKLDLPSGPPLPERSEPLVYRLAIDAGGRLSWNGAPVAEAELPARLAAVEREGHDAELHFRADAETRYEDFDRVLASVKRAGIVRFALVGNQGHAGAIDG